MPQVGFAVCNSEGKSCTPCRYSAYSTLAASAYSLHDFLGCFDALAYIWIDEWKTAGWNAISFLPKKIKRTSRTRWLSTSLQKAHPTHPFPSIHLTFSLSPKVWMVWDTAHSASDSLVTVPQISPFDWYPVGGEHRLHWWLGCDTTSGSAKIDGRNDYKATSFDLFGLSMCKCGWKRGEPQWFGPLAPQPDLFEGPSLSCRRRGTWCTPQVLQLSQERQELWREFLVVGLGLWNPWQSGSKAEAPVSLSMVLHCFSAWPCSADELKELRSEVSLAQSVEICKGPGYAG